MFGRNAGNTVLSSPSRENETEGERGKEGRDREIRSLGREEIRRRVGLRIETG